MSGNIEDLSVGLDLHDEGLEAGLRDAEARVAASMRKIGSMRAEAEIKADISDVEEKEKRAALLLDRWKAKKATATLDVDEKKADTVLKGMETRLKNLGNAKTELTAELSARSKATAAELDKIAKSTANLRGEQKQQISQTKQAENALVSWAGKISDTTLRMGPFTSSLAGAGKIVVTLAPILMGVVGALGALTSVLGAGLIGAVGLGGAALTGFGLAAVGIAGALEPLKKQLTTITTASNAYATAVDKYGSKSKQAAVAQKALDSTLQHMSPTARAAFSDLGRLQAAWTNLTAPTRRAALDTLGSGISALGKLMPMLATDTNRAAAAIGSGLSKAFSDLGSSGGKATVGKIFGGFDAALPSLIGGLTKLAAAGGHFIAAFSGGPLKGIATDFENWATGVDKASSGTNRMAQIADETTSAFKRVGGVVEASGKVLFQFFRGGLGAGSGLTDNITNSLNKLATSMSTVAGQQKLQGFFSRSVASATLLWSAIKPLLGAFVNFANIMTPFASAASHIAAALASVTKAASGLGGVGSLIQGAFGYSLVRSLPIVGAGLKTVESGLLGMVGVSGGLKGIPAALEGIGVEAGPLGLAAAALVALAIGFAQLAGGESSEAKAAHDNAAAHKEEKAAITDAANATAISADKGLAAKEATLDLKQAKENLAKVEKDQPKNLMAIHQAQDLEARAAIASTAAHKAYTSQLVTENAAHKQAITVADQAIQKAVKSEAALKQQNDLRKKEPSLFVGGADNTNSPAAQRLLRTQADYQNNVTDAVKAYYKAVATADVSDASRTRLMQGATAIQGKYAEGILKVVQALGKSGDSANQQAKILRNSQTTLSAAGNAIAGGVKSSSVISVLADTGDAKSKIDAINRLKLDPKNLVINASPAGALAAFAQINGAQLKTQVVKVLASTESAAQKIRDLVALGIPAKTARILVIDGATAILAGVRGLLAGLQGKTIDITTNHIDNFIVTHSGARNGLPAHGGASNATGRGPGSAQRSLVGEKPGGDEWIIDPARGTSWKTRGPMVTDLSASSYVIPTEGPYAGRGPSLLAGAARDLGLAGYAKGRAAQIAGHVGKGAGLAAAASKLPVPAAYSAGGVSTDLATKRESDAQKRYADREHTIHDLEGKITDAQKSKKGKKGKPLHAVEDKIKTLQSKLGTAQSSEGTLYLHWQQAKKDLAALNAINAKIALLDKRQQNDRTKMANAAAIGDKGAWTTAQTDRAGILDQLKSLYKAAADSAPKNSQLLADLQGSIQDNASDSIDNNGPYSDSSVVAPQSLADYINSSPALKSQLGGLSLNLARDTATGADTTGDTSAINAFYQGLINSGGLTQDQQTEAYGDMTAPGAASAGLSDDVQAQLAQIAANGGYLAQAGVINDAYRTAALGSGDIDPGDGGGTGVTNNIYTLHPGDPATLRAIGDASVAGMGYQAARPNPVLATGL